MHGVKHGAGHAQFPGSLVHEINERLRGAGDLFGERHRGVVGRLDHQRVQHLVNRERFLVRKPYLRTAGVGSFGADDHLFLK